MHPELAPVRAAAERLHAHLGEAPPLAIVLGSGLGPLVDRVEVSAAARFDELDLPQSSVPGHEGRAYRGRLAGAEVVVMAGRVHLYEGWSAAEVVRGVRALEAWGVQRVLLTCSAGGIGDGFEPGSLAVVTDHINLQRDNPLHGPVYKGERFPDLTHAYDAEMSAALRDAAGELGHTLLEGVYAAMNGPGYETPAEIRMLAAVGASLVGMSTVPEVTAAVAAGMRVAVLSVVSNRAAGLEGAVLDHSEVTQVASAATATVTQIVERAAARL